MIKTMTKEEVNKAFKSGKGIAIAEACKAYFKEQIKARQYKVIEYYKPSSSVEKNINGGQDIIGVAEELFAT